MHADRRTVVNYDEVGSVFWDNNYNDEFEQVSFCRPTLRETRIFAVKQKDINI